jgi:hypothetical protein
LIVLVTTSLAALALLCTYACTSTAPVALGDGGAREASTGGTASDAAPESGATPSPDGQGYCCPLYPADASSATSCSVPFGGGEFSSTQSCLSLNYDPGNLETLYTREVDVHGCQGWSKLCTWMPMKICGDAYQDAGAFTCADGG